MVVHVQEIESKTNKKRSIEAKRQNYDIVLRCFVLFGAIERGKPRTETRQRQRSLHGGIHFTTMEAMTATMATMPYRSPTDTFVRDHMQLHRKTWKVWIANPSYKDAYCIARKHVWSIARKAAGSRTRTESEIPLFSGSSGQKACLRYQFPTFINDSRVSLVVAVHSDPCRRQRQREEN